MQQPVSSFPTRLRGSLRYSFVEELTSQRPHVVLEATSHYSKPLVSFFSSHGYPVVILNPLLTHQLKNKATRKVKTDPIDAMRIAQVFYLEAPQPAFKPTPDVAELQALCRQYAQWTALYTDAQLHVHAVIAFPGYDKAFQNICNPTSLQLLHEYPSPEDLPHADPEDILRILLRNRRGRSWNEKKREHLLAIARQSLPDPQTAFAQRIAIRNAITSCCCNPIERAV